jgi:hypothetical protein
MGALLLAAVLLVVIFLALALFARTGPTETLSAPGIPAELAGVAQLSLSELGSVTARLFNELGMTTVSSSEQPGRFDLIVQDPTPVTGQKAYVRCVLTPDAGAVQSAEVQAALDTARADHLTKAVVVTPGRFSDEAQLVARTTSLELIDGAKLADLLRAHLADVANRLGVPR